MYGIQGFDDEEALRQLLMPRSEAPNEGFQAQPMQAPELAQLLGGDVTQQMQDMGEDGSDTAQAMYALGQQLGANGAAAGRNRIAQQQAANQAAMQQDQQNKGGLLSGLLKLGAGVALNNWLGGMFPKRGG